MTVGLTVRFVTVAAGFAIAASACAVDLGKAATGPATIRITDRQMSNRRFGTGPGSREQISFSLHSRSGHTIGSANMLCTYFDKSTRICTTVFTLPRGSLVVEGQLTSRLIYELSIVGGTDLYENARGTLTATSLTLGPPRRDLLLFRLVG